MNRLLRHQRLNHSEQAIYHFRQVLDRVPDDLDAIREIVPLYDELGQPEKADEVIVIARAVGAGSNSLSEGATLALIQARHGIATGTVPKEVEGHFRKAIAAQPDLVEARVEYAHWLDIMERNADAVPMLMEGLKQPPYHPDLAAHLAWALADSGIDLGQASHWFQIARQHYPQDPYLSDTQAWIEYRKGNYPGALEALQPSLPHAEQVPEIAYHAGAIHAKLRNRSEAVHFLRLSLQFGQPFNGQKEAKALLESLK